MNIVEALKLSNKVKINGPRGSFFIDSSIGDYIHIPMEYLSLIGWEPVLPKLKTVKKKFYQILVSVEANKYFILDKVFETLDH